MRNNNPDKLNRREFLHLMGFGSIAGILNRFKGSAASEPPKLDSDIELIFHVDLGRTRMIVKKHHEEVYSTGWGVAGVEINNALIDYLKTRNNLLIGRVTAEEAILKIGSALPLENHRSVVVRGRDTVNGEPKAVEVNDSEVREAISHVLDDIVRHIAETVKYSTTLKNIAPDFVPKHLILEGEYGQIKKLDQRIQEATGLAVHRRYRPVNA